MKSRLVMAIVAALLFGAVAGAATKPNILLIMADDQGYGDTGYTGHPIVQTPNLDAMSKVGLRFDRFYAAAPVCSPTRGSVMTGRNPNRFGCFQWGNTLRPQETTIPEALHRADYVTGLFGKWHLGSVYAGDPVNPGNSGFDDWLSSPNFFDLNPILSRRGVAEQFHGASSIVAADAAIDFMQAQHKAGKKFFTVVWFASPHNPHRAEAEDKAPYLNDKRANWLGEITELDRAIGKLRATLRQMKIERDTLVWYCSDNGGLFEASSGGREKKGSIYEGGLRVPAIIEWPGHIEPRVIVQPAVTSDIYPTLVELTGVKIDHQPPLDGVSLMPLIEGSDHIDRGPVGFWRDDAKGVPVHSYELLKTLLDEQKAGPVHLSPEELHANAGDLSKKYSPNDFGGHAAWLDWPWKLHRIQHDDKPVQFELYNLADDPMEAHDVANRQPDRVKSMTRALDQWHASVIRSLNGEDYAHE